MPQYTQLPHFNVDKVHESDVLISHDASPLNPGFSARLFITPEISPVGRARSISPRPSPPSPSQTWRVKIQRFFARNQGLLLVSFSQLFGSFMNAIARLLERGGQGMHPFQILFTRQSLTAIFCSIWMWWNNVPDFPLGPKGLRGLLVARSISGFFGIFGMYYSLQYLPIADAVVITFLAPSVASYGCYFFLSEPFPRSAQYASFSSLLGVILIARPTSFFGNSQNGDTTQNNDTVYPAPTSGQRLGAIGVSLLGVLGAAGAFTTVRWIGKRAHPLISVNYFSTCCTLISILALTLSRPLHISDLDPRLPNGLREWFMMISLGVCGFVMQYLLTRGLSSQGAGARSMNMVYTNMLFAIALDRIVFGVSPSVWSLAGGGCILGSAVWIAMTQEEMGKGIPEHGRVREGEEQLSASTGESSRP